MKNKFPKTLVTGARGMVGSYMDFGIKTDRDTLDVTNLEAVLAIVKAHKPKVIMHLAALTDLDVAEKNPALAYNINTVGTYNVALAARMIKAKLVYISSTGVFDGTKKGPYNEKDVPNPQNYYGHSKYAGELIILAARPSMGKTALALNIAWHVAARLLQPVAIFSLEMSQESLLTRMLCAAARVDSQRFRAGYLNEQERQKLRAAANQMVEAPIYIDDTAGANLMDMHARLRRLQQSGQKLGLVVVDYLQLMSVRGRTENRNQEVSQLSRGLKLLSKELSCPFLVLSQLSRATETRIGDHRPQLSDLRESGSIEQDADLVGFIFREEVYKRDREDLRGVAELILAKQRNGPIGKIDLVFLHSMTKFENRAEDMGDLPPE